MSFAYNTTVKQPVKRPRRRLQSTVKKVVEVPQLIKGATCSEADVEHLKGWLNKGGYGTYSFNIAVRDDEGKVSYHPRISQPCWGELRTHYRDIRKPSDLHDPFPAGTPVAIAIWSGSHDTEVLSYMLSAESPWSSVNGRCGVEYVMNGNEIRGFVLRDMDIDPTVLGQMLLILKGGRWTETFKKLIAKGANPNAAFLVAWSTNPSYWGRTQEPNWNGEINAYAMVGKVNLKRFFRRNPRQITIDANTFTERGAYNRVNVHDLFNDKESVTLKELYEKDYPKVTEEDMLKICSDLVERYS